MTHQFRWPLALLAELALLSAACGGAAARHTSPQATATAPASGTAAGDDPKLPARLQRALDRAREESGAPGVSAAVIGPGARVWLGTSGFADVRRRQP